MTARVVEMTMAWWRGEHAMVLAWLTALGCRVEGPTSHVWVVTGLLGSRHGLAAGIEPITLAAQLGLILAGGWWPQVFPRLIEAAARAWKAAQEQEKIGALSTVSGRRRGPAR